MNQRYKKSWLTSFLMAAILIWSVPAIAQIAQDDLNQFDRTEMEVIERYLAGDLQTLSFTERRIISDYEKLNVKKEHNLISSVIKMQTGIALSEDFSGGIPAGWTVEDISGSGFTWEVGGAQGVPYSDFIIADSDDAGSGNNVVTSIKTSAIDITGLSNVTLALTHDYNDLGSSFALIEWSVDNENWTELQQYNADARSAIDEFDITDAVDGNNEVWFRFTYDDADSWAWWWALDEVVVYEDDSDPAPEFVGAQTHNLGVTYVGGTYETDYTIGNDGDADLTVDYVDSDIEISVSGLPVTVSPGTEEIITVTFSDAIAGEYEGAFELTTNDTMNESVVVDVVSSVQEPLITGFINEDFNDVAATELPDGWVGNFGVRSDGGLDDSQRLARNLWSFASTGQVGTNFVELGDNPELSLHYRVVNFSGYPGTPTPSDNVAFTIYVSTDLASTFEPVFTYDPAEHVESSDYAEISVDLGDYTGETAMLMVSAERFDGDFWLDFDDVRLGTPPSEPILVVSHEEMNFGEIFTNDFAMQEFTVSNDGGASMDVEVDSDNSLFIVDGPAMFTLEAGESQELQVVYNPLDNEGAHSGTVTVTADGADGSPATIAVSGSAVAPPVAGVTPENISVTAEVGDAGVSETLTISNTGSADLEFTLGVDLDQHPEAHQARPEPRDFVYEKQGITIKESTRALKAPVVPGILSVVDQPISFEEDEGFELGFIGGQEGWSTFESNTLQPVVSDVRASNGVYSLELSEHPELGFANIGAFSPVFLAEGDLITASVDVFIEDSGGSDYDFIIQSPSQELLTARVKFHWQNGIRVVDVDDTGELDFMVTGHNWTVGEWATLEIEVNVPDETIDYYYNGEHIWEGVLFGATNVEQIVMFHDNFNDGESGFMDNIIIEAEDLWLSLDMTSGVVESGGSVDVTIDFNTTDFAPGEYIATLVVNSNDPETGTINVPITYTLEGDEPTIGWANLQWPPEETIEEGGNFTVYGMVWAEGVTGSGDDVVELDMWVGISSDDTHPNTWDEEAWTLGEFNNSQDNNDEYMATVGADLEMGTYYYATRYQYADEPYVYGGTSEEDGGFWEEGVNVSGVLTVEESVSIDNTEVPAVFTLKQNYPNPFNPSTTIRFGLPEASDVTLEVYNLLGQRVAVLVNESRTAGYHNINFDASSLSSGMYIYRIQAGSFVETRKLMLVK